MIIDLPATTTSQVNSKLVHLREQGGANTIGRVLTLVIVTDDSERTEEVIDAANHASREHPCRVIVLARGAKKASARLDAQIRVGGDAGASEVVVLRLYGPLANEGASCVVPLLLPDAPVVAWWPFEAPAVPADDPIGQLATRRITDAAAERNPTRALEARAKAYADGDTDLAWTRLTLWRAVLASALDLPPYEKVTGATVSGEADSPSADLLAAWLAARLRMPVHRTRSKSGPGIVRVELDRKSGPVVLERPDGTVGELTQPGQPARRVALQRRQVRDCIAEELRRLDADEIYHSALRALGKVDRRAKPASSGKASSSGKTAAARRKPAAEKPANEQSGTEQPGADGSTESANTKQTNTKQTGRKATARRQPAKARAGS
ncbi:glucose-6-phosphate dehydrogenase assembly protein OpcA [Actinophytocola xanthii]|uniref:Glucose-6-phosphate dehydrogenase assembly protein OpcA n=1 Tax=Actinophytocola xanthii TaxID=1912961 RepID=A0A1Q8CYR7_9PSEU|nr:glucose-6-phosphate dehydrogenase assembly protein OpcA [Actinophytocola xanthii]OLF19507.1 glucose-6-phosphate dehydrogenase assembly protein OpcA [Actinophytocola xanthii]